MILPQSTAHAEPANQKIDKAVVADLKDGEATFLVRLKGEANLSAARAATTKAAKGKAMYDAKTAHAKTSQAGLRALLTERKAEHTPFWIVNAILVTADAKLTAEIAGRPEVIAIEPNEKIEKPKPKPGKTHPRVKAGTAAVEWNIDRINAPRVWNELNNQGEGILVGVIDSGVDFEHPALAAQYRGRRADGSVDHNHNWFTTELCGDAPCDSTGHGTHVAGTIVGEGGIGVAPKARWIAATEGDSVADGIQSGQWMAAPTDLNGENARPDLAPDIVNNSWSWLTRDDLFQPVFDAWLAAGIFPAFANGNYGAICDTSTYSPAWNVESYSAGSFDVNNEIASDSSRGAGKGGEIKPNIAAPGVDIRSSEPGRTYGSRRGTSHASPHVAGTVALMWSAAPALRRNVAATRALLDGTAIDTADLTCGGTAEDNNVFGEGRLDAYAAVTAAPAQPLGTLNGTVTANGQAVANADVTVTGPQGRTVATGTDGTYSVPRLPPGAYQITASRYGHTSPAPVTVNVVAGQTTTADVTLTRVPHGVVSGTITVENTPQAGITVVAADTPLKTVTDAAGRYELPLPHGSHRLDITAPSHCVATAAAQITVAGDITENVALSVKRNDFGYTCEVGDEPYVAGTERLPLGDTQPTTRVALPFPVPFYGVARSEIWVTAQGFASFAEPFPTFDNEPLPDLSEPNLAVYPFWEMLRLHADSGVYTAAVGTAPHRSFVIEWRNVAPSKANDERHSFSVLLGEDGTIGYRYKDIQTARDQGSSATIGIEDAEGTDPLQYSYDTLSLRDGQSITFSAAEYGVVRGKVTDAGDGEPIAGAKVEFPHFATLTTGEDGTFTGQILAGERSAEVSKEYYGTAFKDVTVTPNDVTTLNTELITGKVTAAPARSDVTAPPGTTKTATVTLTNGGTAPTPYEATTEDDWLTVSPAAGGLLRNASATLTLTADTTGLAPGDTRTGEVTIRSASGRQPTITIPVTLTVSA
ncbi:S8 family serine peptidase [Spongiactinospora sp. 9N601]|uniref:S8 family serine peptidase n=1 Tax=Spongiactinospora sp. 9N601 TaxID=3375149 RepID=UPI00379B22AD